MKKFVFAFLVAIAAPGFNPPIAHAGARLSIDGGEAVTLADVHALDGTTYVSVPELLNALELSFDWQARNEKLTARLADAFLVVAPGTPFVLAGTRTYRMQTPPRYINGTLFAPTELIERALPELLGKPLTLASIRPTPVPDLAANLFQARNIRRVVVDAGHGGHDTGARSPTGINEKDINLAIAKKVRDRLVEDFEIDVVMTRETDVFIPLGERTAIGNRAGAELFLCIHANGSTNRAATGLETYFLAFEATDRQAARIAAEENRVASLDPTSPFAALAEGDDLKRILIDLVSAENMKASEKLAAAVQRRMVQTLRLPNRGVKQAPFFVLVGSKIPAILVEVGFVSNPYEAAALANPAVQDEIANALFHAIVYYDETLSN
ncbi:N-acetylmuramoyl-L-alanine amidase [bacterium]|nr:N-acetylmuramoyl-L-alanine amidase [bacterium]